MEKNKLLKSALWYRRKEFSVIPCKPKTKEALISWQEYQERKPTEEEITKWWTQTPDANIGIVLGKVSGLITLEVDDEKAINNKHLPITPQAVSGGKGLPHLYFRYLEGMKNYKAHENGRELYSIRGNGQYVLVPPSIHPSGKPYTWAYGLGIHQVELAELPEWIIELVIKREKTTNTNEKTYEHLFKGEVKEGGRNNVLTSYAGKLKSYNMNIGEAKHILNSLNQIHCTPPLEESEVENIVNSVYRYKNTDGFEIKLTAWNELIGTEEPEIEFLIEDLLPLACLILLAGKPKLGKSLLALLIALSVGLGQSLWNKKVRKGNVLFISTEDGVIRLKKRIWKMLGNPVDFNPNFHFYCGDLILTKKNVFEELKKTVAELKPTLIVLDPLINLFRGRELNSGEDMNEVLRPLQVLAKESRACVLVIHHVRKTGGDDPTDVVQGSTTISGVADGLLILRSLKGNNNEEKKATLEVILKDAEIPQKVVLKLDQNLRWEVEGSFEEFTVKTTGEKIIEFLKDGEATINQTVQAIGESYDTVQKAYRRLEENEEVIKKSGKGKGRGGGNIYSLPEVKKTKELSKTLSENNSENVSENKNTIDSDSYDTKRGIFGYIENVSDNPETCPKIKDEDMPEVIR